MRPFESVSRRTIALAGTAIVIAAVAAYHNSFSGPFIFDDESAVTNNSSIRHLASVFLPRPNTTTGGRPLVQLTFALNYAWGGLNVWGYHAVNLLIHALAGLTLFGIVRRTLRGPVLGPRFGAAARPLALAISVIWVVHPLQTETVAYITQRCESLMGFFYLLTLYCFIRGMESTAQTRWQTASVLACFLGAISKEFIVTAPLLTLIYDRTFVAGSFREALRRRWRYYLGLADTWLLLAALMVSVRQRDAGFGLGVTWWDYALTSCRSIALYLKLAVWPHPLVLDYGTDIIRHPAEIWPYASVLAALVVGTGIALWRWPAAGFAGAWFFIILSPSSSVVPLVGQPTAEHRMYLPLAAIISLGVLWLYAKIGRYSVHVLFAAAVGFGWLTVQRNHDYRSELGIWADTAAKCPDNERALENLGLALAKTPGRLSEAMADYKKALLISPGSLQAHNNLGNALMKIPGRWQEAIVEYQAALRIDPDDAETHSNLADALEKMPGRRTEAIHEYETALRINPDYAKAHNDLGCALKNIPGRQAEAIAHLQTALQIMPDYAEAHYNLGMILSAMPGRISDAVAEYEAALRYNPDFADAQYNLGYILLFVPGRLPEALLHLQAAVRIRPDDAEARCFLGLALSHFPGRAAEAMAEYKTALHIDPGLELARQNLDQLQAAQSRLSTDTKK